MDRTTRHVLVLARPDKTTLKTGGTHVEAARRRAGRRYAGGQSRDIGPGDMVIIPTNSPHGFSEITEAITYIVVRVDPDQLVALK